MPPANGARTPPLWLPRSAAVAEADLIVANLLFLEEHLNAIVPALTARRDHCDALVGVIADTAIVKLTKMGDLDMSKPQSAAMTILKSLRGSSKPSASSGAKQMKTLRRLPKILRLIPGKSQDLRAWFLSMQYWLGGSDENIEQMLRFLIGRYATRTEFRGLKAARPRRLPRSGRLSPRLPGHHLATDACAKLPSRRSLWRPSAC
jgi:magnesium chelatase subunit H